MTNAWKNTRCETNQKPRGEKLFVKMKKMRLLISGLGLSLICFWFSGCETARPAADTRSRFQEEASADLILRFSRWDTIYMTRPDLRVGGFLTVLTRASLEHQLKTQPLEHNLAVVVLGFRFSPEEEAQLAGEWNELLAGCGYRRVVILRTGRGKTTDGLLIVRDSGIAAAHDKAWPAPPPAALPPAARTNAADSSGH
jgi:hypothetical protein